jgi:Zn finger protein HypA/HybF involved in hydrogenase expression
MALFTLEDCDGYCKKCKKHFVVALEGHSCPECGQCDPETVNIIMGGSFGHEEPASFRKFRIKRWLQV